MVDVVGTCTRCFGDFSSDGESSAFDFFALSRIGGVINDFNKVDSDGSRRNMGVGSRVVNELSELGDTDLTGFLPEDEEHGIDDIGLAATVGADDSRECLVEGADAVLTSVGFEVFDFDVTNDETILMCGSSRCLKLFLWWHFLIII